MQVHDTDTKPVEVVLPKDFVETYRQAEIGFGQTIQFEDRDSVFTCDIDRISLACVPRVIITANDPEQPEPRFLQEVFQHVRRGRERSKKDKICSFCHLVMQLPEVKPFC